MRSGLVVTFLFYPVEDLAQNVHRCVLNYNRDEVVARRRAAGLPVNLDEKEQGGEKTTAQSTVTSTSEDHPKQTGDKSKEPLAAATTTRENPPSLSPGNSVLGPISTVPNSEVVTSLRNALNEAAKRPKQFKNWTNTAHGLRLSVLQDADSRRSFRVATIAVKNNAREPLQLLANTPEILIETIDETGTTVEIHSLAGIHTESSNPSGVIAPGATAYIAIAYVSPPLDVRQQLKIVMAHTSAADQPASIKLTTNHR